MANLDIASLTRLLQLGDSALPVGGFSFSHGLESAVAVGMVKDKATLRDFLHTVLRQAAGVDGVALLWAHRYAREGDLERVVSADQTLLARKLNEESRTMSVRMGRKLAEFAGAVLEAPMTTRWLEEIVAGRAPGNYALGQGLVFADSGLGEQEAFAVHAYGTASAIMGASLRLMRIDHLTTQRLLAEAAAGAQAEYLRIRDVALEGMASYTPSLDILAAIHVKAHVRLFMN
jgi:urease accessory protein